MLCDGLAVACELGDKAPMLMLGDDHLVRFPFGTSGLEHTEQDAADGDIRLVVGDRLAVLVILTVDGDMGIDCLPRRASLRLKGFTPWSPE